MAYQSLYRRYRPRRFSEVRGQDHVTRALRNAVREDRVAHAYLFSGPRGTGKTSTARILAKALNCQAPVDGEPDGTCASCLAVDAGTSYDLHELDAASNNSVNDVRDLIAKAALATPGREKVYILDEVHMLSGAAANALLKTLEEPPGHVTFVLATTDPRKVLPTIRSRCQHHEFRLLSADELEAFVRWVAADAGLEVDDASVATVVRQGGGSARDTLSALELAVAAGGAAEDVAVADELVEALCERDAGRALATVEEAVRSGQDPRELGATVIRRLRDAFLAELGADVSHLPAADRERATAQGRRLGRALAVRSIETLGDALVEIQRKLDARIALEVALVRLTRPEADPSPAALLDRVERLERRIAELEATGPPATATTTPPPAPAPPRPPAAPATPAPPASPATAPAASPAPAPAPAAPMAVPSSRPPMAAPPRPARQPAGPPPPPAAGPAAAARRRLAERAERDRADRGERPSRPSPARAPAARQGPPAPEPAPAPAPAPAPRGAPAGGAGSLPTRDELTLAWADHVLAVLPKPARARFLAGRFVDVTGDAALFALPNATHRERCEELRPAVESALAAHFGRSVPLRLVVEGDTGGPPERDDRMEDVDDLLDVDVHALPDADVGVRSGIDRLTEAFPGARLVDGD